MRKKKKELSAPFKATNILMKLKEDFNLPISITCKGRNSWNDLSVIEVEYKDDPTIEWLYQSVEFLALWAAADGKESAKEKEVSNND